MLVMDNGYRKSQFTCFIYLVSGKMLTFTKQLLEAANCRFAIDAAVLQLGFDYVPEHPGIPLPHKLFFYQKF
jgi:hypothetical protein